VNEKRMEIDVPIERAPGHEDSPIIPGGGDACYFRGEKYDEGSRVCSEQGHWLYCHNGRWLDTQRRCGVGP
jgi:hypothetical protein